MQFWSYWSLFILDAAFYVFFSNGFFSVKAFIWDLPLKSVYRHQKSDSMPSPFKATEPISILQPVHPHTHTSPMDVPISLQFSAFQISINMMLYFLPPRSFFSVHLIITIYRRTNTQWSFIPFFFCFELLNCSIVLGGIWIGSLVALLHGHDGLASPLPASTRLYCIHYCSIQWVCRALCFGCFFVSSFLFSVSCRILMPSFLLLLFGWLYRTPSTGG